MMAPSASIPKPNVSPLEKVAKFFAAAMEEGKVRFEKACQAYQAEMAWQLARRTPAQAALTTRQTVLAGLVIDLETGNRLLLQEGLNVFGKQSLRVEDGRVEGCGANAGRSHYTNDIVALDGRQYVLKLFSGSRFSTRTEVQQEEKCER
jgi:hypothetical protein